MSVAKPSARACTATATTIPEQIFPLVYRQMRSLAGHRDVDELAQVAMEQVLRSLPSFRGKSHLATWTFRICYRTICKHDRWYRRWLRRFALTETGELPEPACEACLDEAVERRERLARLQVAMERLSAKRRIVLVLHDIEDLSVDAIAEIVGAGPATVRSRLRDARHALARELASDPYFGDEACARTRGGGT